MTKKPWEKLKYLENEKSFYDEIKKHFSSFSKCFQSRKYHKYHILKGLSITQIPQIPHFERAFNHTNTTNLSERFLSDSDFKKGC